MLSPDLNYLDIFSDEIATAEKKQDENGDLWF